MSLLTITAIALLPTAVIGLGLGGVVRSLPALAVLVLLAATSYRSLVSRVLGTSSLRYLDAPDVVPLLLLGFTLLECVRGYLNGQLTVASAMSFAGLWVAWSLVSLEFRRNREFIRAIALGPIVYVIINVALWILRAPPPPNPYSESGSALILGAFGIHTTRTLFPLALGVNGFGLIAGLATALVLCRASLETTRRSRWWGLLPVVLLALLLSDSRGAMLAVLVVTPVTLIALRQRSRAAKALIPGGMMLLYLLGTVTALVLGALIAPLLQSVGLQRADTPLGGRGVIWLSVLSRIATSDVGHILFGYGMYGQATSGASVGYENLFAHLDIGAIGRVNVHSSMLQQFMDSGLIGVLVVAGILAFCVVASRQSGFDRTDRLLVVTMLLFSVTVGVTDITINPYNNVFFPMLIGLTFAISGRLSPRFREGADAAP